MPGTRLQTPHKFLTVRRSKQLSESVSAHPQSKWLVTGEIDLTAEQL